jgi:hypothetical protein
MGMLRQTVVKQLPMKVLILVEWSLRLKNGFYGKSVDILQNIIYNRLNM